MEHVRYQLELSIQKDQIEEVRQVIETLFKRWRQHAEACEWDLEGDCRMLFTFNQETGEFTFDTGEENDIPIWLRDDTLAALRDIGSHAASGAIVHRTINGKQADFAVGPSNQTIEQAKQKELVRRALNALEDIRGVVPEDVLAGIDELSDDLSRLVQ
jgi:hypothetical protein